MDAASHAQNPNVLRRARARELELASAGKSGLA